MTGPEHHKLWCDRLPEPSFVYVIQGDPDTPIKVGVARDVLDRMKGLQTGNPQELRLLYVIPGSHDVEWQLHYRLRDKRVRGEWFEPCPEFLAFVEDLAERMVRGWKAGKLPVYRMYAPWKEPNKRGEPITFRFAA